jgi:predicted DNA-binding transcriptional regulator YafY
MRHARTRDLLQLALAMAGSREGMSLPEIEARLGVSRRTAERLRAALEAVFPALEYRIEEGRTRRWRLPHGHLSAFLAPTSVELAELEAAARRLRDEGAPPERAAALESLASRVRAAMREGVQRRTAPDVEALMLAEGTAARPGPRPAVPDGVLAILREAILACHEVSFTYRPGSGGPVTRRARPLGLLHGARPYLVASLPNTPGDPTLFRLDRMRDVARCRETFVQDSNFNLAAWASHSFGVWRDEPEEVVLRFSAAIAEEARAYRFHITQAVEDLPDGRLLVRFTAGGRREMIHHLATWSDNVEVIEPFGLRRELAKWAREVARHHGRVPAEQDMSSSDHAGAETP